MPIQLKMKIGQNEVTISGKDEKEIIADASFWGQLPGECGSCHSKEIGFVHSTPSGYEYYMMKCRGCGYEYKFGIRKEDHKLFPKPEKNNTGGWVAPFQGGNDDGYDAPAPRQQAPQRQQPSRPAPRPAPRQQQSEYDDTEIPY